METAYAASLPGIQVENSSTSFYNQYPHFFFAETFDQKNLPNFCKSPNFRQTNILAKQAFMLKFGQTGGNLEKYVFNEKFFFRSIY